MAWGTGESQGARSWIRGKPDPHVFSQETAGPMGTGTDLVRNPLPALRKGLGGKAPSSGTVGAREEGGWSQPDTRSEQWRLSAGTPPDPRTSRNLGWPRDPQSETHPYITPCWDHCGPGPKSQHRCPARFCVSPYRGFQPLCLGGGHRPWAMQEERPHVPTCSRTHPGGFGRRRACGFPGIPPPSLSLRTSCAG